jgi:uncharacterized protein (TIGR02246 family)
MQVTVPGLAEEMARFQQVRMETLRLVEGLSQEELDRSPGSGRWSIGEVLDHLLRAEAFFRRDLGRLVELSRAGRPGHIRHSFRDLDIGPPFIPRALLPALDWPLTLATLVVPGPVLDALADSRLIPMRHPTAAEPRRGRPADDLRRELREASEQTAQLLGQLAARDASRMTISHPLLGVRTVPELIRFMAHHERRHQGQVADLRRGLARHTDAAHGRWDESGHRGPARERPRLSWPGGGSPGIISPTLGIDRRRAMQDRATDSGAPGAGDEDREAIRGVYRRISEAWGRGDAAGVVANFTRDGSLIDPFGRVARERAAVEALLAGNFGGMFRGSRIAFNPQVIRLLARDLAQSDGTWQVTLPPAPGGRAALPIAGLLTTLFRKVDGTWKVEADRPMLPAPLPAEPLASTPSGR